MDAQPDNIQRFNLIAINLFTLLHGAFPVPQQIDPMEVGHAAVPDESTESTAWDMGSEAADAISWLEEEGFIRVQARTLEGSLYGVRLTMKAMTVLGHVPSSIAQSAPRASLISRMKDAVANAGAKAATDAVASIMNEVFSLAVRIAMRPEQAGPTLSA